MFLLGMNTLKAKGCEELKLSWGCVHVSRTDEELWWLTGLSLHYGCSGGGFNACCSASRCPVLY